jgi:FKBP-type peptidyl-prolyl cis-trans isomerase 2
LQVEVEEEEAIMKSMNDEFDDENGEIEVIMELDLDDQNIEVRVGVEVMNDDLVMVDDEVLV